MGIDLDTHMLTFRPTATRGPTFDLHAIPYFTTALQSTGNFGASTASNWLKLQYSTRIGFSAIPDVHFTPRLGQLRTCGNYKDDCSRSISASTPQKALERTCLDT
jgi:hypothetical protein